MVRLLLILAVLHLAACAPEGELGDTAPLGPPFRFNITALPTEYQPWFAQSADEWNTARGKTLILVDPVGYHSATTSHLNGSIVAETFCDDEKCTVSFDSSRSWSVCGDSNTFLFESFQDVAVHEIGHVLRARFPDNPNDVFHSPVGADLMRAGASYGCKSLTSRDIHAIAY